jgi:hypothetical protein
MLFSSPVTTPASTPSRESAACQEVFDALGELYQILSLKLYRLTLDPVLRIPTLPCLDHEAMLHEGIAPHAAAYIQDRASGDLHEIVFVPAERRIALDTVSTWGECAPPSRDRLVSMLRQRFPQYGISVKGPSVLRGERRVAKACRAQVALRDVLLGPDLDRTKAAVDRLQTIGTLMEKESRVASWGARTVMAPLLALAGFLSYEILGTMEARLGPTLVEWLRYGVVGVVGAVFLYYGLKAVQLTEMANRVWKRSAEYGLILSERRRLHATAQSPRGGGGDPVERRG